MHLNTRRILFFIILLAMVVRLGMVWSNYRQNPSYFHHDADAIAAQISNTDTPYQNRFGSEISNVAYALVCKQKGFADPFGGDTGPTGWVAPGMVMLYALAFWLFGCFSTGSILFMFALSLCLSTLTIILIYRVCLHLFNNTTTACIGCLLFALDPQDVLIFKKTGQQDFNVFPFLFIVCFFLFLRCLRSRAAADRLVFSVISTAAILCNPVFVLPSVVCLIYYIVANQADAQRALREVAAGCIVVAVLLTPYAIYQNNRLGTWTFIKSNGAFELYLGNVPDFEGVLTLELFKKHHPMANADEYRAYRDMGETAYIRSKRTSFLETFDPTRFIALSAQRFLNFLFFFPALQAPSLAQHLVYALRGIALIAYLIVCFRSMRSIDILLYAYIAAYALPFIFMGIMYRYSFPIVPFAAVLLGRVLYLGLRRTGVIHTTVT